jgi:hypothetical protein
MLAAGTSFGNKCTLLPTLLLKPLQSANGQHMRRFSVFLALPSATLRAMASRQMVVSSVRCRREAVRGGGLAGGSADGWRQGRAAIVPSRHKSLKKSAAQLTQVDDDAAAAEDDEELEALDLGAGGADGQEDGAKQQKSVRLAADIEDGKGARAA